MIYQTEKTRKRNKTFKIMSLLRDIFPQKNYFRIKDDVIIVKNHWYSLRKEEYTIKEFCGVLVPTVMTSLIEAYDQYQSDLQEVLEKIYLIRHSVEYNENFLVSTVYTTYNLLISALQLNEHIKYKPEFDIPVEYQIVKFSQKKPHLKQKESEIDSILAVMKKSLTHLPVLYCQI